MVDSKWGWSPVEEFAEDEAVAVHIMPVTLVDMFDTEQKAVEFTDWMERLDFPCTTDEEGNVVAHYAGHSLSSSCTCSPAKRDEPAANGLPMWIHNVLQ